MAVPEPDVSIILPTWNGAEDLARLLPALARQSFAGKVELVAIDSSSSDATRELLRAAGAALEVIPQAEFRHGPARNRAAARARGRTLVFLSQDAEPRDERFLTELVRPFADPRVAGAYARIVPTPGVDPLTRRSVLAAPEARAVALAHERGSAAAPAADGALAEARFNNVASAIRASVFRELGFPDVPFGEDLAWAEAALERGQRIVFAHQAVVFHAHAYTPRQAFERYRTDAAFRRFARGERVRPDAWSVARGLLFELREDWRWLAVAPERGERLRWLARALPLRAAQVLGQYRGGRDQAAALFAGASLAPLRVPPVAAAEELAP